MKQNKPHNNTNPIEYQVGARSPSVLSSTCEMFKDLYGATVGTIANVASSLAVTYRESPSAVGAARRPTQLDYDPIATATDNTPLDPIPGQTFKR